jgi:hypothetical protein
MPNRWNGEPKNKQQTKILFDSGENKMYFLFSLCFADGCAFSLSLEADIV